MAVFGRLLARGVAVLAPTDPVGTGVAVGVGVATGASANAMESRTL
jgi:hypothetical protein